MTQTDELPDNEKVRISTDFILHAPPGEFNEVFNDVRVLLNNDQLLKEGCAGAFVQYNKDQMFPVKVEGSSKPALITTFNDLGNGRFYDPRSKQSFFYDHLRKEASDFGSWEADAKAEGWRAAVQTALDTYAENHFKTGIAAVFGKTDSSGRTTLDVCTEAHKFEPKNYWNGRWRSHWSVVFSDKTADLNGVIKVQVHYYEDGNVQLVSSKEIAKKINISNEVNTAKEIAKVIEEEENAYQTAVSENYQAMSDTTFKALRRALPVTRTKLDWGKITSYKIGAELKPSP